MSKGVYYWCITFFAFWACYHCYVGNDIKLISDAVMVIDSFICLEIRNNEK